MNLVISILISVVLAVGVFLILNARMNRRLSPDELVDQVREELSGIIVEMNKTTDRNIELLESRVEQLKGLLADADTRIKLVRGELAKTKRSAELYSHLADRGRGAEPVSAGTEEVRRSAGPDPASGVAAEGTRPEGAAQGASGSAPLSPREAMRTRIIALYNQGFEPQLIASRVGSTVGEVELIISLYERRGESSAAPRELPMDGHP